MVCETGVGESIRSVEKPESAGELTAARWAELDDDPDCYALHLDDEWRILGVTRALSQQLGFEPVEIMDVPVEALLHPESRGTDRTRRTLVGRSGELVEAAFGEQALPDGGWLWRARVPAASRQEDPARLALDHLGDAVLLLDRDGRVRHANAMAGALFADGADSRGLRWDELLPAEPDLAALIDRCLAGFDSGERPIGRQGGQLRGSLVCRPVSGNDGGEGAVIRFTPGPAPAEEAEIRYRAHHDPVTGLCNRWVFRERLEEWLAEEENGVVALLDLDRFKGVNDAAGHAAGDALLRHVASILFESLCSRDLLARMGGDEFGLLLPDCDVDAARDLLTAVRAEVVSRPLSHADRFLNGDFSAGVAPAHGEPSTVLAAADHACYRAKGDGGGRVMVAGG